ncbi:hypothetical protein A8F88_04930 [Escherichia coli]|nr:hypothetical protein A8F88_04930 [Escherichia coli]
MRGACLVWQPPSGISGQNSFSMPYPALQGMNRNGEWLFEVRQLFRLLWNVLTGNHDITVVSA